MPSKEDIEAGKLFLQLVNTPGMRAFFKAFRDGQQAVDELVQRVFDSCVVPTQEAWKAYLDTLEGQKRQRELDEAWKAVKLAWKEKHGEGYPETLEDFTRLAVRSGIDANRVLDGKWTRREVMPLIEGYLAAVRDRGNGQDTGRELAETVEFLREAPASTTHKKENAAETTKLWRASLEQIRDRFARLAGGKPVLAVLIEVQKGYKPDPAIKGLPPFSVPQEDYPTAGRNKPYSVEATRRLGYWGDPSTVAEWCSLAASAGRCLPGAPMHCLEGIPGPTLDFKAPESRWAFVVFDLAWEGVVGSPLCPQTGKSVWNETMEIGLAELPSYRNQPAPEIPPFKKAAEFAKSLPDPPPRWFSTIEDIVQASVFAIEILLSRVDQSGNDQASEKRKRPAAQYADFSYSLANVVRTVDWLKRIVQKEPGKTSIDHFADAAFSLLIFPQGSDPAGRWNYFRSHYPAPPEPLGRFAGASYHELACTLVHHAQALVLSGIHDISAIEKIKNPSRDPAGEVPSDVAEVLTQHWSVLRSNVDSLPDFHAEHLASMVTDEATRAKRAADGIVPASQSQTPKSETLAFGSERKDQEVAAPAKLAKAVAIELKPLLPVVSESRTKKRKRRPDPKREKRKKENEARHAREDTILQEWEGQEWEDYADYMRCKNQDLPDGWLRLTERDVKRAVENAKRRRGRKNADG